MQRRFRRSFSAWFRARCGGVRGAVATITLLGAVAAGVTAQCIVTDSLPVFTHQQTNAAKAGDIALDDGSEGAEFVTADSPAVFTDQETNAAKAGDIALDDGSEGAEFVTTDSPAVFTDQETNAPNAGDLALDEGSEGAEFVTTDSPAVYTDQETNAPNDSLAVYTDQETEAPNGGVLALDAGSDSAFFTFAGMLPGDRTIQPLTITNSGATEFRYAMSTVAGNLDAKNLRDQLSLTIRLKTANPCAAEDGVVIFGPAALANGPFGSAAQGADAGDRVLAGGASEVLCFTAELPLSTGNPYMGAATTATFTFDAEQTANNP